MKEKIIDYIETLESKANDSDKFFVERNNALIEIKRLQEMDKILRNENINLKLRINKAIEILDIYGTSNYETADLLYSALRGSDKE